MSSDHKIRVSDSTTIKFVQGDITEQNVDAIVNAANSSLMGGGGVDGAIHRRGGPRILEECVEIRRTIWKDGLPPGEATITSGGSLKARYVIHTVGPIWSGQGKDALILEACYQKSLALAASKKLSSIAFPSISTGAFGYPIREACSVAIKAVLDYFAQNKMNPIKEIVFVLFTMNDLKIYLESAEGLMRKSR